MLTIKSGSLMGAGRPDEARQRLQRVFDIEPDFWVAQTVRSDLLMVEGNVDAAIESLARADRLSDGSSQTAAALANVLARKGKPERARAVLDRLLDLGKNRYVPPTSTGLIYAGSGDKAAAMAALERGLAVRDVRMTLVQRDPRWSLVHQDPRFTAAMRQMNLA